MSVIKNRITAALIGLLFAVPPGHAEDKAASVQMYQQFEQQIRADIAPLAGKEITGLKVLYLSADVGPWLDTGLALKPGEKLSLILNGKQWLSRAANLSLEAPFSVWSRIGEKGSIFRGARNTNTFSAASTGHLYLKLYPGERWLDNSGKYLGEPAPVNPDAGGGVNVAVIRWAADVDIQSQLKRMAEKSANAWWANAELDRLSSQKLPPAGWDYIWELKTAEIFSEAPASTAQNAPDKAIGLKVHDDASIMEKPAGFDLTPNTTLSWKWKVDKLPSVVAENSMPSHDYMSIAVKFDNGRDLTFYWSRALPVDTAFHCPLPGWSHRETHVVARTGAAELGKWLSEEKNIADYYQKAIGGPLPKRITHVWLIGVSLFQHLEGQSEFGAIALHDQTKTLHVY
ncbi:MAG: DUF3047 domain-containing protein [Methylococcales bacterium]|nr:DUF3047 domain-containing protein [Methylococcales bacterium]